MTVASNIRPKPSQNLVISAQEVKENFLFGIDLRDDDGNEIPDSVIEFYIRSAQHWIERELDIFLTPTTISREAHDYHYDDYTRYGFVTLLNFPVREVTRYTINFPVGSSEIEFDPSWFKIESVGGQVNLVPTKGTFSSILVGQGGAFLPQLYTAQPYIPHIITIDYEAGFEAGCVPFDIIEVMGKKASLGPLNILGDLIAGAGIASKSLSIDGLSQSIATTSSATNAGYGARILNYGREIETAMATLKNEYRALKLVVA